MAVGKTLNMGAPNTAAAVLVRTSDEVTASKTPAVIPQQGFGTLASTSSFRALETHGLRSCVAIVGVNLETGSTFMTHIDGETRASLDLLTARIGKEKHLLYLVYTAPEKTKEEETRSLVRGRNLKAARDFASTLNAEVREITQECEVGSIGITRDGQLYRPDSKNFRAMTVDELFKLKKQQIGPFFDMDHYHSTSRGSVGSYY